MILRRRRWLIGILLLPALVLLIGACAGAAPRPTPTPTATPAAAVKEATVTVLVVNWGNGLFDVPRAEGETLKYQRMLQAWLVESEGGAGEPMIPGIAKSWELSGDGKTWTWTIRSGVKAHNGEEINVDDVVGNLDVRYGVRSKGRTGYGSSDERATQAATIKVEKLAPDKVVHEMKEVFIEMPFRWSSAGVNPAGVVVPQDYWDKVGQDGYDRDPVGAGPFRLVSRKPDQEMVFERFDDYYYQPKNGFAEDRRPKFRRLVMQIVPEAATRAAAIQAGQADLVEANLFMLEDIKKAGGKVVYAKEASYNLTIFVDCWDPKLWCNKKEVRQALEYAVDKESIVKSLYGPEIAEVKGWVNVTPGSLGYVPGVTDPFPYDLKKAKELLAQAGFPDGKGIPPFKIYTWEAGDLPMLPQVSQIVADMWAKIGIQAQVVVGDATSIRNEQKARKLAGNVLIRSNEARWSDVPYLVNFYARPENTSRVCDRTMDPTCERLAQFIEAKYVKLPPMPIAKYEENIKEIHKALKDENHMTAFFYVNTPWGLGPRVKDYKPWSLVAYITAIWTLELK